MLTHDHTVAQKLADLGIGELETLNSRWQHLLSMAVGGKSPIDPQLVSVELNPGDRILLCSAGVHGRVSGEAMQSLLHGPPSMAAWSLIKRVADQHGVDDATVVLVETRQAR
jgi:protein phosphatase